MNAALLGVLVDGIVAVAVIAAAVVLGALGKLEPQTIIALIGVGVALIGGTSKAAVALYTPPPATSTTPPRVP